MSGYRKFPTENPTFGTEKPDKISVRVFSADSFADIER